MDYYYYKWIWIRNALSYTYIKWPHSSPVIYFTVINLPRCNDPVPFLIGWRSVTKCHISSDKFKQSKPLIKLSYSCGDLYPLFEIDCSHVIYECKNWLPWLFMTQVQFMIPVTSVSWNWIGFHYYQHVTGEV